MPREPRDLSAARIVLVGATGGFGRRLTARLVDEGAHVIAVGRDADRLAELPDAVQTVVADLTDPQAPKVVLDAVDEPVDGLVNAAGVVAFGPLEDVSDEVLDTLFTVNAIAPLRLTRALLPHLNDNGVIAHVSGVVAEQPMAGLAAYSASKAALAASLTALRRELRKRSVDVIDFRPPHTETGLATRPLAGEAPPLPEGADPDAVVDVMVRSIREGAREVGPDAFA